MCIVGCWCCRIAKISFTIVHSVLPCLLPALDLHLPVLASEALHLLLTEQAQPHCFVKQTNCTTHIVVLCSDNKSLNTIRLPANCGRYEPNLIPYTFAHCNLAKRYRPNHTDMHDVPHSNNQHRLKVDSNKSCSLPPFSESKVNSLL